MEEPIVVDRMFLEMQEFDFVLIHSLLNFSDLITFAFAQHNFRWRMSMALEEPKMMLQRCSDAE